MWLDCDREGEAIAYEVIEICEEVNQNLNIYRALFSSITYQDIMQAYERPVRPDRNKNDAVMARQEIDLRSGAAFTRL